MGWPAPACTFAELHHAREQLRALPVITLRQALERLNYVDPATLDALEADDPALLRNRSPELVQRFLLTTEQLHHALSCMAGVPAVDLVRFPVHAEAWSLLPLAHARPYEVVPLGLDQDQFFMASWAPTNEDSLRFLSSVTGHRVTLVWASRESIAAKLTAISRSVAAQAPVARDFSAPSATSAPRVEFLPAVDTLPVEDLLSVALIEVALGQEQVQSESLSEASGVVRLVRKIIMDAEKMGASDVHIETNPGEQITRVRMRRDGDLEPYLELPARLRSPLVSRIKVMARLDIAERRRPQDGKINFADFGGDKIELRVAIMPTHDGMEDVVMRLLASSKPIPLDQLGLQARDRATLATMMSHSFGLILAAGPTGSGKTTTLHSLLAEINTEERKIWTAEDPIEISQPGLRQVQVNPKIGLTFAGAMRAFLRADPDIIMIGEIRDEETARVTIEASLTGHLVLSTLHTNSAAESVLRLLDMGMDAMNFADSLIGVISQRLVRALCRRCAVGKLLIPEQFERLVTEYIEGTHLSAQEGRARLLEAAGVSSPEEVRLYTPKGCPHCRNSGYKGRLGIYEVLQNSATLRPLIQKAARPAELFDAAVASGMRSLRHDAIEKLVQGKVDIRQAIAAYR
jgi:type II secretory ATPase GspE/PulE/Tfp pilus assembly ATPase PilB-like protein